MTEFGGDTGRAGPSIFFSAGEVSGDFQASHLARAVLRQAPSARLYGCGGEKMSASGVDVRLQTSQFGYVGLRESLRFKKPVVAAHRKIKTILREERPDLAVLVDGERFNKPLIEIFHREQIPFVYYFVPQVLFWGRWRTRHIAARARLVVPAFPNELEIFRRKGARAEWLGHPFLDIVQADEDPENCLRQAGLDPNRPIVALMPGSRWQEIENFGPILFETARRLQASRPSLQFILPVAGAHLLIRLQQLLGACGMADVVHIVTENSYSFLSRCSLVLLSSGTATLETALLGVPMVVFYRVCPLTFMAAMLLVNSRYIAMPNILLAAPVVPELIQDQFTVERLEAEAGRLLDDPALLLEVRRRLAEIPALLGVRGVLERAAAAVLREANSTYHVGADAEVVQ